MKEILNAVDSIGYTRKGWALLESTDTLEKPTSRVGLRISARGLDPDQITLLLGISPDHVHREGDYPRGDARYSAYKHGMWALNSKLPSEEPFLAHLEHLLAVLEPVQPHLVALSEHNDVDFYCSLFDQVGVHLPPLLLGRIAGIGAALSIAVYPPDHDLDDRLSNTEE